MADADHDVARIQVLRGHGFQPPAAKLPVIVDAVGAEAFHGRETESDPYAQPVALRAACMPRARGYRALPGKGVRDGTRPRTSFRLFKQRHQSPDGVVDNHLRRAFDFFRFTGRQVEHAQLVHQRDALCLATRTGQRYRESGKPGVVSALSNRYHQYVAESVELARTQHQAGRLAPRISWLSTGSRRTVTMSPRSNTVFTRPLCPLDGRCPTAPGPPVALPSDRIARPGLPGCSGVSVRV